MKKTFSSFLLSFIISFSLIGQHHQDLLDPIYTQSLQGRVDVALQILDTLDMTHLSEKQKSISSKYKARFSEGDINFEYTGNTKIDELLKLFHSYWITTLTEPSAQETAEKLLKENLLDLLQGQPQFSKVSKRKLSRNTSDYCGEYIESLGFHGIAYSKTAHIRDIFLWRKMEMKKHDITLLDNQVSVNVNEMSDFISKGWLGFATFDRSHAGGWATKEALFAVIEAYDTTSENYEISYLHHEGQHFSDYINFPKLEGADLEYRAKLTELVLLEGGFWSKLETFIRNGAEIPDQPHPFANYTIINELSQRLLNQKRVTEIEVWRTVGKEKIQQACRELYNAHTQNLKKKGAKKVEKYINRNVK